MGFLSLYPRLVPTVNLSILSDSDRSLLDSLSKGFSEPGERGGWYLTPAPRVVRVGSDRFLLEDTGCDYSQHVRDQILLMWHCLRASSVLCDIIKAAQSSCMPQIIFSFDGMIPDQVKPATIGSIGRGKVGKKTVLGLLKSLKLVHEDLWPIEQLANVVEPVAAKTRKTKKTKKAKKG
jgi:hypothetical protein